MKIKQASFLRGAVGPSQYPEEGYMEIALCGRSNVGKSSLINRFIQRKNLARTSSQPGKTQQLNYYFVETDITPFYFVDLPGYGFAKASRTERAKWGKFIEEYLLHREVCHVIWQVIDLRHAPSADDIAMYEWLQYNDRPVRLIATKADKLAKGQWQKQVHLIQKSLGATTPIQIFSSTTDYGLNVLYDEAETLLRAHQE